MAPTNENIICFCNLHANRMIASWVRQGREGGIGNLSPIDSVAHFYREAAKKMDARYMREVPASVRENLCTESKKKAFEAKGNQVSNLAAFESRRLLGGGTGAGNLHAMPTAIATPVADTVKTASGVETGVGKPMGAATATDTDTGTGTGTEGAQQKLSKAKAKARALPLPKPKEKRRKRATDLSV